MASATMTTYDPVVKELWPQKRINNLVLAEQPFLAMVQKDEGFFGDNYNLALQYTNPMGRSAAFATAQTNAVGGLFKKFVLTRVSDYAVATVSGELIEASGNNKGAIISSLDNELEGALGELGRSMHKSSWHNGSGSRGKVGAYTATQTTLTLGTIADVGHFDVGQVIKVAATETGAVRAGSATITAVNRDTGVLTASAAWDTGIAAIAVADFLYVEGDAQNNSTAVMLSGVRAWVPTTAPSSTTFFGVDRTADTVRLGGIRYDGTSDGSIKEALLKAAFRGAREGYTGKGGRKVCYMHPEDLGNLTIELGSQVTYDKLSAGDVKVKRADGTTGMQVADVGFDTIVLHTALGRIDVLCDTFVAKGFAWILSMDTWTFATLLKAPRLIEHDGLRVARQATSDGVEFRATYRGQLGCDAPGWNIVCTLPT